MRASGARILPLFLLAGLAAPAAAAPPAGRSRRADPPGAGASPAPLAVGDSVMLGAFRGLRSAGFEVNARVCRQMGEGVDLLAARERAGTLPDVVVVALGTNWVVTDGGHPPRAADRSARAGCSGWSRRGRPAARRAPTRHGSARRAAAGPHA